MMDKKACLLAILVIFGLTVCFVMQSDAGGPPLPNDIKIIPPAPDLPKDIAAFSGKWAGKWDNGTETILIVEEIHDTWVQVVHCWSDTPRTKAGYNRRKCKIISDPKPKIVLDFQRMPEITFEMNDSNALVGTQTWSHMDKGSRVFKVNMNRAN
jgi:hypothetical protein